VTATQQIKHTSCGDDTFPRKFPRNFLIWALCTRTFFAQDNVIQYGTYENFLCLIFLFIFYVDGQRDRRVKRVVRTHFPEISKKFPRLGLVYKNFFCPLKTFKYDTYENFFLSHCVAGHSMNRLCQFGKTKKQNTKNGWSIWVITVIHLQKKKDCWYGMGTTGVTHGVLLVILHLYNTVFRSGRWMTSLGPPLLHLLFGLYPTVIDADSCRLLHLFWIFIIRVAVLFWVIQTHTPKSTHLYSVCPYLSADSPSLPPPLYRAHTAM